MRLVFFFSKNETFVQYLSVTVPLLLVDAVITEREGKGLRLQITHT